MLKEQNLILHEESDIDYCCKDIRAYQSIIRNWKKGNEDSGRKSISSRQLSELFEMDYEMFRKILNAQKPTKKRDFIISVGIMLKMNSLTINKCLSYYDNMPILNKADKRDALLIYMANDENKNITGERKNLAEINEELEIGGFPELDIFDNKVKSNKQEKNMPFKILDKKVVTFLDDLYYGDQYDSLESEYSFERYRCVATMWLENIINGNCYKLSAEPTGKYFLEILKSQDDTDMSFKLYNNLEDTDIYQSYFAKLQKIAQHELLNMKKYLNDTRNYGERISADMHNDTIHIYLEKYNYRIPERNEFYLMEYIDGDYRLSVFKNSVFMQNYLGENKYQKNYFQKIDTPREIYKSLREIDNQLNESRLTCSDECLLKMRKNAYINMQPIVERFLTRLRKKELFIRNLKVIYDNPDQVCSYYGIEREFECLHDQENGYISAGVNAATFEIGNEETVNVKLSDVKRAFELGFSDITQICNVLRCKGKIEAVLD